MKILPFHRNRISVEPVWRMDGSIEWMSTETQDRTYSPYVWWIKRVIAALKSFPTKMV